MTGCGEDESWFEINNGSIEDGRVKFVKQYCGKWTHAIYYSGVMDETERVITGFWGWTPGSH